MEEKLIINCDGGARGNPGPAAYGFIIKKQGKIVAEEGKYIGEATNNIAEYSAVLAAWKWIIKNESSAKEVEFYLDSELIVKQLTGAYRVKSPNLSSYAIKIKDMERQVAAKVKYAHVYRKDNSRADALVNEVLDSPRD